MFRRVEALCRGASDSQELRVGIRVDVSAGLRVEELAKIVRVDEVAINRDGHSIGAVDVERLGFGAGE